MKQITVITLSFFLLLFNSCGPKKDPLESKKEEVKALSSQVKVLQNKIKELENEISILDTTTKKVSRVPVEVASVLPQDLKHFIKVQGTISSDNDVVVAPKIPNAIITKVFVKEGQFVKRGQLLASMDDIVLRSSLDELNTSFNMAEDVYNRQKRLWDQKIGSEMQYLQAKTNKESLENRIATTNEQLAMYRIYAPISGVVDQVMVKVGQAGMDPRTGGAFRIVNLNDLKFKSEISESYLAQVKKGDKVEIDFPSAEKNIKSVIKVVASSIHPTRRTFEVEASIPAGNQDLKTNMVGDLSINDRTVKNALVIPQSILQKTGTGNYVFKAVEKEGEWRAVRTIVETGLEHQGKVEITKGLAEGDKLIVVGFQDLSDGQVITFKPKS